MSQKCRRCSSYDVQSASGLCNYCISHPEKQSSITTVEPQIDKCGLCNRDWHPGVNCVEDVAKQPHYTRFKIQPITFIEANNLSYSQGNVIKYVCRYEFKDGLKDLQKIKVYVDYLIQKLEKGEVIP